VAGIHRETHYWWLKHDPAYAVAFAQAEEKAADALEAEARRRAINGVLRYKFDKGRPITNPETGEPYYELEYSDTLLIFLLKAHKPTVYRETVHQQHSGTLHVFNDFEQALDKAYGDGDGDGDGSPSDGGAAASGTRIPRGDSRRVPRSTDISTPPDTKRTNAIIS